MFACPKCVSAVKKSIVFPRSLAQHYRGGPGSPDTAVRGLTLMLMYLTSWQERVGELRRCWKGYDFDILDELAERDLISTSQRATPIRPRSMPSSVKASAVG